MKAEMEAVGVREFREKLSDYLEKSVPVAITRHGETIGFYLPVPRKRAEADWDKFDRAAARLDKLLAARGATEDELVDEFKRLRRQGRK